VDPLLLTVLLLVVTALLLVAGRRVLGRGASAPVANGMTLLAVAVIVGAPATYLAICNLCSLIA
jgi:hypothetical protein